jgi:hypothetical protein
MKACKGRKGLSCVNGALVQGLDQFHKSPRMKDGHSNVCKSCEKARQSERYLENRDEVLDRTKAYGKANRHVTRKASKNYYSKNREASIQRKLDWCKQNPEKAAASAANYRANKRQATPVWLTEDHREEILRVYEHSKECRMLTGDEYHVDHIVPLAGENVCGLHVPWNLQVLPSDINIAKSNKYHGEETLRSKS